MKSIRAVMFAAAISMASSTAVFAADSVTAEAPVETAIETTEAAEAICSKWEAKSSEIYSYLIKSLISGE